MSSSANRTLRTLAVCWLALLAAAGAATTATATFSASFKAERSASWGQPRGVDLTDCHGQHYYAANGKDKASIKTRRPFKITVTQISRGLFWQFGDLPTGHDPLAYGIEAASFAQRERERFDFYNCPLAVPEGMHVGSFPTLPAKVNRAALFGRSRRPIVITASKDYGPTSSPLPNLGVERTSSGRVTWKLRLIRIVRARARSDRAAGDGRGR
jgi:hypothetical protein